MVPVAFGEGNTLLSLALRLIYMGFNLAPWISLSSFFNWICLSRDCPLLEPSYSGYIWILTYLTTGFNISHWPIPYRSTVVAYLKFYLT